AQTPTAKRPAGREWPSASSLKPQFMLTRLFKIQSAVRITAAAAAAAIAIACCTGCGRSAPRTDASEVSTWQPALTSAEQLAGCYFTSEDKAPLTEIKSKA